MSSFAEEELFEGHVAQRRRREGAAEHAAGGGPDDLVQLEALANRNGQVRETAQLRAILDGGPVVQRVLSVNGEARAADAIAVDDEVLTEEATKAHLAPDAVRDKLLERANDDTARDYGTWRAAVQAAIASLTGVDVAEASVGSAMDTVPAFEGFQKSEAWRLLMDGKHQEARGKFGFENEKGYMAALMNAFAAMLQGLGQQLTAVAIEQLHDLALGGVLDRQGDAMETGYRDDLYYAEGFGVDNDSWSAGGHAELVHKYNVARDGDERYPEGHPVGAGLVTHPDEMVGPGVVGNKVLRVRPKLRHACVRAADTVLEVFYNEIAEAADEGEQLTTIATAVQDLEQLHLFVDGNLRTLAFLVLNKLLIENNLSPVILDEPNVFDCKSAAELVAAIRTGQQEFQKYVA